MKGEFNMFNIEQFIGSLKYMWQGMLCIFVVMGVIILSVYLIGAITAKADAKKKAKEEAENNN